MLSLLLLMWLRQEKRPFHWAPRFPGMSLDTSDAHRTHCVSRKRRDACDMKLTYLVPHHRAGLADCCRHWHSMCVGPPADQGKR